MLGIDAQRGDSGILDFTIGFVTSSVGQKASTYNSYIAGGFLAPWSTVVLFSLFYLLSTKFKKLFLARMSIAFDIVFSIFFVSFFWLPLLSFVLTFTSGYQKHFIKKQKDNVNPEVRIEPKFEIDS
ncbi:hypothetical protein K2227_05830 [Shewanella putrefaciens]|nr:hypothetical protein K2227_05830 [Shewanella putrefaciens]